MCYTSLLETDLIGRNPEGVCPKSFYGYIQECLKGWSDMYAQSKRLTEPVLPQDSSSSSTPIDCELVGDNGCIWSKDVHDVNKSQSQISKVFPTSREMYSGLVAKSVIALTKGVTRSLPSLHLHLRSLLAQKQLHLQSSL